MFYRRFSTPDDTIFLNPWSGFLQRDSFTEGSPTRDVRKKVKRVRIPITDTPPRQNAKDPAEELSQNVDDLEKALQISRLSYETDIMKKQLEQSNPTSSQLEQELLGSCKDPAIRQGLYLSLEQDKEIQKEKERMKERLAVYGFAEKNVEGDGNCLFRAVAEQLYQNENKHLLVRQIAVEWLRKNGNYLVDKNCYLKDFLDKDKEDNWDQYCDKMELDGTWGDHIVLLAIAEVWQINICIFTSIELSAANSDPFILLRPFSNTKKHNKTIYLSHWHERHYASLQPIHNNIE